jgi:hypothetical protein
MPIITLFIRVEAVLNTTSDHDVIFGLFQCPALGVDRCSTAVRYRVEQLFGLDE